MDLEGKKGEDMDSLFEGMVLFNPAEEKDNGSDDSLTISSCSQSQPLDENLFSDLTLVVDPLQNLEVAEAERDLQSRQGHAPARRRKRSGLRIGYGRDAFSSNDPPHTPSPLPQPISDSDSVGDADAVRVRDTDTDTETLPSITTATATATDDPVTVTLTQPSNESENQNRKHQQSSTESSSRSENEISDAAHDSSTESSSAEFRQLKSSIHDKLNHATQLVKSASSARKDSIRNRRKTVENANLASLKHMELEKQLEEACEAEDFERAEKVSDDLSAAEKEKQAFANSLREADAFVDALDLKLQHALDSQLAIEEQCAILLDHYATVSQVKHTCSCTTFIFLPLHSL